MTDAEDTPLATDPLLENAWSIIANAGGGDWDSQTPEWKAAAERWRDAYHDRLHLERQVADAVDQQENHGRGTIAVDFDGVLHEYVSPWTHWSEVHDGPVEGALQWLADIQAHYDVAIISSRAQTDGGKKAIRSWLEQHGVKHSRMLITADKVMALVYIDDRAYRFEGPGTFPTLDDIAAMRPWNRPPLKGANA